MPAIKPFPKCLEEGEPNQRKINMVCFLDLVPVKCCHKMADWDNLHSSPWRPKKEGFGV